MLHFWAIPVGTMLAEAGAEVISKMARVLVVYYSRTGTTRKVANDLATALDADIEEIVDVPSHEGRFGLLRAFFEGKEAAIRPNLVDPARYDLVVIGTPVWDGGASSPVRSYLTANEGRISKVALFSTSHGIGGTKAVQEMALILDKKPVSTLVLRESEVTRNAMGTWVARFLGEISDALSGPRKAKRVTDTIGDRGCMPSFALAS